MPRTSGLPVAFVVATVVIAAAAFVGGRFTAGEGPDPCGTISTEPKKIDAAYDLALEGQRMMEAGNIVDAVKKGQLSLVSSATGKAHFVLARSAFIEHRDKDAFFHMMCTSRLDPEGDEVRWALEKIRRRD